MHIFWYPTSLISSKYFFISFHNICIGWCSTELHGKYTVWFLEQLITSWYLILAFWNFKLTTWKSLNTTTMTTTKNLGLDQSWAAAVLELTATTENSEVSVQFWPAGFFRTSLQFSFSFHRIVTVSVLACNYCFNAVISLFFESRNTT